MLRSIFEAMRSATLVGSTSPEDAAAVNLQQYEHLLEPHELAELGPSTTQSLPLDLVDPNPLNPRRELAEVEQLAENIRTFGLLQPVIVRRAGERYELLGGHRRRAAVMLLREREPHDPRWRVLDSVVRTADDDESYLMLISTQVHNRAWRPREEAHALERLVTAGLSLKQIGDRLNRTENWAGKRLRVYSDSILSAPVQLGRLPSSVAEELLLIQDVQTKRDYAERAAIEGWSQDRARGEVRALRLDKQLLEVGRQAKALLTILSSIDASKLPPDAKADLWMLRGRIIALGRGPIVPSIAEAERAAGVNPDAKPRRRPGRPKQRRVMPLPS